MSGPEIALIAAMAANRVIGKDNRLPWQLPAEWRYFYDKTVGHPLVMGRRSYQSHGGALPDRPNIVLSRAPDFHPLDADVAPDIVSALMLAGEMIRAGKAKGEIMIGGGEGVYRDALPYARRIYLTEIALSPQGDTYFPVFSPGEWREAARKPAREGDVAYDFVTYERIGKPAPYL